MVLTLLVGLLSFAEPAKTAPEKPLTEAYVRDGKLVIVGDDFEATAQRFMISADGKYLDLRGTDDEPVVLRRPTRQGKSEYSGKRIVFSPSEGTVRVIEAGKIDHLRQSRPLTVRHDPALPQPEQPREGAMNQRR